MANLERPYLASLNPGFSFSGSPGEAVSSFPEPRFVFKQQPPEKCFLASLNPGMSFSGSPGEAPRFLVSLNPARDVFFLNSRDKCFLPLLNPDISLSDSSGRGASYFLASLNPVFTNYSNLCSDKLASYRFKITVKGIPELLKIRFSNVRRVNRKYKHNF